MEIRVQVAYHFRIDPAQQVPGLARLPEQITRTVSVGEEMNTEKVGRDCLSAADQAAIMVELDKQVREVTRVARPAGAAPLPEMASNESEKTEEASAF